MRRFGIWFIVIGLLAYVPPHFGLYWRPYVLLGDKADWVAIGLIVAGAALVVASYRKKPPAATV